MSNSMAILIQQLLGEHTKRGKLKVYLYYGDRTDDLMELTKYDRVLTTYTTLGSELNLESPMFRVAWWRVILDEAHMIKNSNAQQTRAVNKLIADRRNYWNTLVQRPVDHGDEFGLTRLPAVMATICLRRTKDKGLLGLPHKMMEICYIDHSAEERELYDRMEGEAKTVVRDYISSNRVANNYTTVLSIILRLRQICTDVDLCPKDLIASLPPINIEGLNGLIWRESRCTTKSDFTSLAFYFINILKNLTSV
ncbi:hypothetical protein POM88_011452 [Heracleum sosnowskyi]|uniref:SNF2 N-terminal domain-containing protein n=1 Tax=Heracleum sosnowskyi TaxID=360622 RepID=A0AAD8IX19_9APIA|nr:hypothetical protein POM88_011452 [Heracleum sosnowskyi]